MSDFKQEKKLEDWIDTNKGWILDESSEAIENLRKIFHDLDSAKQPFSQPLPLCPECRGIYVSQPLLGIRHTCQKKII